MKTRRTLFLVLFAVPLFVLVAVTVTKKLGPPPAPPGAKPSTEVVPEYKAAILEWTNSEYEQLQSRSDVAEAVRSIPRSNGDVLVTQTQQDLLLQAIESFVWAFREGSLEAYFKFRVAGAPFRYDERSIEWLGSELKKRYLREGEKLPTVPEEIFAKYWERCYGGAAFSNYWDGLCISRSKITLTKTAAVPGRLADYASTQQNAGRVTLRPTFLLEPSAEAVAEKTGELYSATVWLLVRNTRPEPPRPVVCRFYWVPEVSRWLPMELVSCYVGPRQVDVVF